MNIFVIVLLLRSIYDAQATEISESSHLIDSSLGFDILLPVLSCNTKFTGYKTISWYKDFTLLKNGSASLQLHILSLSNLLSTSEEYDNVMKLQGYYWCKTEVASTDHKYLFRIRRVHTYVGYLYATQDSIEDDENVSFEDKIFEKRKTYEKEMEHTLFGFLPMPNTFVHKITTLESGLKIHFFLYVQQPILPRMRSTSDLLIDQQHLGHIEDYIANRTDTDADYMKEMLYWASFRGILLPQIELKSTRGCYETVTYLQAEPPIKILWPDAEIGEIVIPEESCSSKNGLAVTRTCMGSFNSGASWSARYGKCDVQPSEHTLALKELYNGFQEQSGSKVINKLKDLTHGSELSVTDIHIATNTLKELSMLPDLYQDDVNNLFSVIDDVLEVKRSNLNASKDTINLTNRILQVIENILSISTAESKELQVTKPNLLADVKNTKTKEEKHIIGLGVLPSLTNHTTSFEFLSNGTKLLTTHHRSDAYFLLPSDLVIERESYLMFPCQVSLVLYKDWGLFPDAKHLLVKQQYRVLSSPVMHVGLSGGPAWNLPDPVQIYFKNKYKASIENPLCVHFDPRLNSEYGGWSTEGCHYAGLKDGFFHCKCHHLSIFAVLLAIDPAHRATYQLGASIYVACGISIIALALAVLLYFLSKTWRSAVDHHILFWLCFSFLGSLILIFVSEFESLWRPGCFVQALILYYFILVTICWLLVQSVLHQLRFAKKTDTSEVPFFMLKCFASAWGIPAIIVLIIALARKYEYYSHNNCWPNVVKVSEVAIIPIIIIIFLTFCINLSAAYAITCRFKKDFLVGENNYNEPVLKFRVAVSIFFMFVLCVAFGYLALHRTAKELQILFSISTIVTAYYLTLFFIFHEISFWDLCRRWKNKEPSADANDIVAFKNAAKTYKSTESN